MTWRRVSARSSSDRSPPSLSMVESLRWLARLRKVDEPRIEKWPRKKGASWNAEQSTVHEGYSPLDAQVRASYPKGEVRPCRPEGTEQCEKA